MQDIHHSIDMNDPTLTSSTALNNVWQPDEIRIECVGQTIQFFDMPMPVQEYLLSERHKRWIDLILSVDPSYNDRSANENWVFDCRSASPVVNGKIRAYRITHYDLETGTYTRDYLRWHDPHRESEEEYVTRMKTRYVDKQATITYDDPDPLPDENWDEDYLEELDYRYRNAKLAVRDGRMGPWILPPPMEDDDTSSDG